MIRASICFAVGALGLWVLPSVVLAARAPVAERARDPYLGAVVMDAASGQVLFSEHADAPGYPASVLKLMDLYVILDQIEHGTIHLTDSVTITAEAAGMGGSQVFLKEKEVFTVEDLLYALMIQSANDAALALAIHVAGSKEGFVALMNEKAKALGMIQTSFHSVHGLPPAQGQEPDVTTAQDLAVLCRALVQQPKALELTSTRERGFRNNSFIMRTHNSLLASFPGCDGLKTGYFRAAGYSIATTAVRDGRRIIAVVVLGSVSKEVRDRKAAELLSRGFLVLPK